MALWVGIPNDMITFEGNETKKTELIEKLERHARLDAFMKGSYGNDESGENFKGCAVGCTLFSYGESVDDHSAYERLFGIPEEIARLEDRIFEGLPNEKSKDWPLRFSRAVPVGKDISGVAKAFKIRILEECLVYDRKAFPQVDKAVHLVIQALKGNGYLCAAESAAWSAARSAASAARRRVRRLVRRRVRRPVRRVRRPVRRLVRRRVRRLVRRVLRRVRLVRRRVRRLVRRVLRV